LDLATLQIKDGSFGYSVATVDTQEILAHQIFLQANLTPHPV
jgi:D-serine deaminase-like pyridoxal phosphate-dependent protein